MRTESPIIAILAAAAMAACAHAPTHVGSAYALHANYQLGGEGRWDLLAVDSVRHHVFISRSDHVDIIDTGTGQRVGTLAGTDGVHSIAVAAKLGRGFTTNGKANSLSEFDLVGLQRIRDIPLSGQSPDAIVFDAFSAHLFAFNAHSNDVSIVDAANGKEIAVLGFEGNPELPAADGHGRLFVNIEDKAQLVEIDTAAMKVLQTWPLTGCEGPTGLALDTAHHRLFSACDNKVMAVTDAKDGHQIALLPIGEGPDGAVFDSHSQSVFIPNGKSGTLTVIHEDDPDHFRVVQTVTTQLGARTIELDPATHRLYLPTARFGPKPADAKQRPPILPDSFSLLMVSP